MADPFEFGRRSAPPVLPGDFDAHADAGDSAHPLDSEEMRALHRKLMGWFYHERTKQAANRLEMAIDADFYDGQQWDSNDADALRARGQMPLVFNEVAPMIDWLIGTERRSRVDWRVMPRTEDDVELADIKTKVLKFVADNNRVTFLRSRAFADAVKVGVGWMDDGARDDPTSDPIYSRYESWRNVLWDSSGFDADLSDARFVFRWRWVDEDVALMMFPDRREKILRAMRDSEDLDGEDWYLGDPVSAGNGINSLGFGDQDQSRRRVRLIECQFKCPAKVMIVVDGPMAGSFAPEGDLLILSHVQSSGASIIEKVAMRMHIAVMTDSDLLSFSPSPYRHNKFTLTPIWCYRRDSDRLPYGLIRRVRDVQQDLNKRASKALFMLNTNQIIADEGAVDDWNVLREEADRPDGLIIKKRGSELALRRDTDAATGQVQMMTLDAQAIQRVSGVNDENMGRRTNAVSGEAIKARQLQGAVSTTEPFDNLRLAVQEQGTKQLSLIEQFYSAEKVVRLTGERNAIEWVKINTPELQPDGSVRFLNDITAGAADFIVSDADYAGTVRQQLFEAMNQLAGRLPPEISVRILTIALDFSDFPNKDQIVEQLRKVTGERDPDKELSPEEQQAEAMAAQEKAEAAEVQKRHALLALEEQQARVAKLHAEAQAIAARSGGQSTEKLDAIRRQADAQLEQMAQQLRQVQAKFESEIRAIRSDADVRLEVARIEADARIRVAEIAADAKERLDGMKYWRDDDAGENQGSDYGVVPGQ